MKHDFEISDQGTIVLMTPMNEQAQAWCDDNLGVDTCYWCGSVVIDHRCARDIVHAAVNDNLSVRFL